MSCHNKCKNMDCSSLSREECSMGEGDSCCDWSTQPPSSPYNPQHLKGFSYECSPHLGCHLVKTVPDGLNRFTTFNECEKKCQNNVGNFSYECSPHGCKKSNKPAGNGRFSNLQDCARNCKPLKPSSYLCSPYLGCHADSRAPGRGSDGMRYSNMQTCNNACSKKPLRPHSYVCSPNIGCHVDNRAPGPGRYNNWHDCGENCSIPVAPVWPDWAIGTIEANPLIQWEPTGYNS